MIEIKAIMSLASADAWIQFFGSIIGALIGILFAYFNTKRQIKREKESEKEKRERELLPYFNIDSLGLVEDSFCPEQCDAQGLCFSKTKWELQLEYATVFSTLVPIQNVDVSLYTRSIGKVSQKSLGHIQPGVKVNVLFSKQTYESDYAKSNKSDSLKAWEEDIENKLRVDIKCKTALGNDVFFTYGNDINATSYYKNEGKWTLYSGTETNGSKTRLEDSL
ncbi:hypothetical protein [Lacticaseibacillus paracasei]|uniref:hypothetical protein n=1 Tax=Lacticaseibacillus paracasei TaxID=1597 RepID=UPI0013A56D01|nr:hypothetical protein [Lacticaseibacillus paracasei]